MWPQDQFCDKSNPVMNSLTYLHYIERILNINSTYNYCLHCQGCAVKNRNSTDSKVYMDVYLLYYKCLPKGVAFSESLFIWLRNVIN